MIRGALRRTPNPFLINELSCSGRGSLYFLPLPYRAGSGIHMAAEHNQEQQSEIKTLDHQGQGAGYLTYAINDHQAGRHIVAIRSRSKTSSA